MEPGRLVGQVSPHLRQGKALTYTLPIAELFSSAFMNAVLVLLLGCIAQYLVLVVVELKAIRANDEYREDRLKRIEDCLADVLVELTLPRRDRLDLMSTDERAEWVHDREKILSRAEELRSTSQHNRD